MSKLALLTGLTIGNASVLNELLEKASDDLTTLLQPDYYSRYLQPLVETLSTTKHLFILGRGKQFPLALETALKIKEASYIHAEAFASGQLKHGALALIESGTPVIALAADDETRLATISNALEVKSRGGYVIGVGQTEDKNYDVWLPLPGDTSTSIFTQTLIGQLLSYYLALHRGINPDRPRNLAKSVTVR